MASCWFFARQPAAQARSARPSDRHGHSDGERMRRRVGKPREHDHDQKAAGDAEAGYRVGVALGELEHRTVLSASKTVSGEMARMRGVDRRAALVSGRGGRRAQDLERVAVRTVARGVGGAEDRDAGFAERGGDVERTAIDADHGGGAPRRVDQAGQSGDVGESGTRRAVQDQRQSELVAQAAARTR